jgi:hypothetical protein
MVINKIYLIQATLMLLGLLGLNCKKNQNCSEEGIQYVYSNYTVNYSPGLDSIPLGSSLIVEAALPKSFFDQNFQKTVSCTETTIIGPFNISKLVSNPNLTFAGAISDMELTPLKGVLIKDTLHFSTSQLESFRTAYWEGNQSDSFRLKINVKPQVRGTFFISIRDQGNKNSNCALFKYLPMVTNLDKHFYLMTPITNGEISDIAQKFVYCFKVF